MEKLLLQMRELDMLYPADKRWTWGYCVPWVDKFIYSLREHNLVEDSNKGGLGEEDICAGFALIMTCVGLSMLAIIFILSACIINRYAFRQVNHCVCSIFFPLICNIVLSETRCREILRAIMLILHLKKGLWWRLIIQCSSSIFCLRISVALHIWINKELKEE